MTAPELTSAQRARLRKLAHGLDPTVQVGQRGATEAVIRALDEALLARELVKVKLAGDRVARKGTARELASATGASLAGEIGRMAILYRPHPDLERRTIFPV